MLKMLVDGVKEQNVQRTALIFAGALASGMYGH